MGGEQGQPQGREDDFASRAAAGHPSPGERRVGANIAGREKRVWVDYRGGKGAGAKNGRSPFAAHAIRFEAGCCLVAVA
eukprot:6189808-Pyramimonas_sp.AAC.1